MSKMTRAARRLGCLLFLAAALALPTASGAAGPEVVVLDHAAISGSGTQSVSKFVRVAPGEVIQIRLTNTCKGLFAVSHIAFRQEVDTAPLTETTPSCGDTLDYRIIHDPEYGGYLFQVEGGEVEATDGSTRKPFTALVAVGRRGWSPEFAGAFTVSDLTSPKYSISGEGSIVRDEAREDEYSLGIASFVHMTHSATPKLALSFGLGIGTGNDLGFFLGPSWRLGGRAWVTAGWNLGRIDTLPGGEAVGRPPSGDNVLNNLGSKTDGGFFFSVSYSFISGAADRLRGPFAPPAQE